MLPNAEWQVGEAPKKQQTSRGIMYDLPETEITKETGGLPSEERELLLFIGAMQASREKSWAMTIPLANREDNQPIEASINTAQQREFIDRWVVILEYAGARGISSESGKQAAVVVDPKVSWRELLFRNLRGKSQMLITPDRFWTNYSSFTVAIIERSTGRVLDSFQITQPGR